MNQHNNFTYNSSVYIIVATISVVILAPKFLHIIYSSLHKLTKQPILSTTSNDIICNEVNNIIQEANNNNDSTSLKITSINESIKQEQSDLLSTTPKTFVVTTDSDKILDLSNTNQQKSDDNEISTNALIKEKSTISKQKQRQQEQNWRCACENGFLPPGLLKNFSNAEAMIKLGTGSCYHKM